MGEELLVMGPSGRRITDERAHCRAAPSGQEIANCDPIGHKQRLICITALTEIRTMGFRFSPAHTREAAAQQS